MAYQYGTKLTPVSAGVKRALAPNTTDFPAVGNGLGGLPIRKGCYPYFVTKATNLAGPFRLTAIRSVELQDGFLGIQQYSDFGIFKWNTCGDLEYTVKAFWSGQEIAASAIAKDSEGNFYIVANVNNGTQEVGLLVKLTQSLNVVFSKLISLPSPDATKLNDIAIGADGSIYVLGSVYLNSGSQWHVLTCKLNTSGAIASSVRSAYTTSPVHPNSLKVLSNGNIAIAYGWYDGTNTIPVIQVLNPSLVQVASTRITGGTGAGLYYDNDLTAQYGGFLYIAAFDGYSDNWSQAVHVFKFDVSTMSLVWSRKVSHTERIVPSSIKVNDDGIFVLTTKTISSAARLSVYGFSHDGGGLYNKTLYRQVGGDLAYGSALFQKRLFLFSGSDNALYSLPVNGSLSGVFGDYTLTDDVMTPSATTFTYSGVGGLTAITLTQSDTSVTIGNKTPITFSKKDLV